MGRWRKSAAVLWLAELDNQPALIGCAGRGAPIMWPAHRSHVSSPTCLILLDSLVLLLWYSITVHTSLRAISPRLLLSLFARTITTVV